jgi:hypothetical protein
LQNEQQFVSLVHERLDALRAEAEAAVRTATSQVGTGLQARVGKEIATSADVHAAIDTVWPSLTPQRLVADQSRAPSWTLREAGPCRSVARGRGQMCSLSSCIGCRWKGGRSTVSKAGRARRDHPGLALMPVLAAAQAANETAS